MFMKDRITFLFLSYFIIQSIICYDMKKNSQSDYVITYNVVFFLCTEKLCMI